MAGQSSIIRQTREALQRAGWIVAYVCIPNTAHVGVVPIPTPEGVSRQRYPDIVCMKGEITRLVEVEMRLNENVARDILLRFTEMNAALRRPERWELWRTQVARECGVKMPERFVPRFDLILCSAVGVEDSGPLRLLEENGIHVCVDPKLIPP